MAHLKKSPITGHLLKNANGHLVKGCTGAGGGENGCNDCDPAIPDTLYITCADLTQVLAYANGTNPINVHDINPCRWEDVWPDPDTGVFRITLRLLWTNLHLVVPDPIADTWYWLASANVFRGGSPPYSVTKYWYRLNPCDAYGTYTEYTCDPTGGLCDAQDGATCEISETP